MFIDIHPNLQLVKKSNLFYSVIKSKNFIPFVTSLEMCITVLESPINRRPTISKISPKVQQDHIEDKFCIVFLIGIIKFYC